MNMLPETAMLKYVELRDKRSALKKKYDAADKEMVDVMDKIEAWFLKKMGDAGTDTIKNDAGTAYIQVKKRYSAADWPGYWAWLRENNRLDMLEKRVSATAVKEYEAEYKELPPFLNVSAEREVVIRRA